LVVKPWLKIRVRFSGAIPEPVSATLMAITSSSRAAVEMTSSRLCDASMASTAFRNRLSNTC